MSGVSSQKLLSRVPLAELIGRSDEIVRLEYHSAG